MNKEHDHLNGFLNGLVTYRARSLSAANLVLMAFPPCLLRYEPAVLARNFATGKDDDVRAKDAPERLLHFFSRRELGDEERREEAKAASRRLVAHRRRCRPDELLASSSSAAGGEDPTVIAELKACEDACYRVLELVHNGFEVPFIATYRPDEYQPHLTRQDLWRLFDMDAEWDATQVC